MTINYQLFNNIDGNVCSVLRTGDGEYTSIPVDPENTDYQEYLEWLAEGNTPDPAE